MAHRVTIYQVSGLLSSSNTQLRTDTVFVAMNLRTLCRANRRGMTPNRHLYLDPGKFVAVYPTNTCIHLRTVRNNDTSSRFYTLDRAPQVDVWIVLYVAIACCII
jgi:hypothetical protein